MRKLMILLLTLLTVVAAGCGSDKQPLPSENKKIAVQQGGQLKYGSLQEPNTLNPLLSDFLSTAEVGRLLFSGLVITGDKGEWLPDLAVDVPTMANGGVTPDGLRITYRLRQGVKWHDGMEFTAEDVKFTWQLIMNRKVNIVWRDGYDKISDIETPDKYTVVIKFKEFYAPYLTLFTTILPKHRLENAGDINKAAFNRAPIGTGPFKFKDWQIAEAVVLEANTSYYRGKPVLDSIVYKVIPDANLLLTQLKTGELDIASNIGFSYLEQVKALDGIRTVIAPTMVWEHMDFNLDNVLFQDVRVRKAIALAIDPQAIITNVLKGVASPAYADQSPLSWAYNPMQQPTGKDINTARNLLAQAGWQPGSDGIMTKENKKLAFSLTTPTGNRQREQTAQKIAEQLKEIGVLVEVRPVEGQVFFSEVLKNRRFETALYAWMSGIDPDNTNLWHSRKIPGAANAYTGQNYPGWRNPEVDRLTELGVRTVDIAARKDIYFLIQDFIRQDCPVVPLFFRGNIDAVKTSVANYQPNPTPSGNMWNAWQWGFTITK
ncbi:peptide ABC transporter substrate-binding protein [Sporomusa sphaeroides]|uniref:Oligopeptide-binding protein AppA n=2 Tax=Sporomusa TaxID=2375 RepID=A0ABP2C615_9FIRM|nr:peptide ABC transporter substrate-binding protein [Sporomusa sphaeroides]OLS58655.1 oligopeptide-binding protein AppA precursor [Sporomusa sphaeroides DSM 2875]CVK19835.1 Oligopeptide-binding protein AppA precursor [Sporomusa sphaeroides DSM 2875]SCM79919.1 Oligopeptide-binding protein AppA [uncultured Sporomusa sp.]